MNFDVADAEVHDGQREQDDLRDDGRGPREPSPAPQSVGEDGPDRGGGDDREGPGEK